MPQVPLPHAIAVALGAVLFVAAFADPPRTGGDAAVTAVDRPAGRPARRRHGPSGFLDKNASSAPFVSHQPSDP